MLLGYTAWITDVCNQPELVALRQRNAQRLAVLKAANSLTEKHERTSASQLAAARQHAELARNGYVRNSALGGIGVGHCLAELVNDRGTVECQRS